MTRRQYAGGAAATAITTPIASSGGGTVTIATTTGWPDGAVGKFHVVIDPGNSSEEKILMDLRSGTTLSFSSGGRGADGTVSTSHSAGAQVWLCYTALDADEANAHINAASGSHTAAQISFAPTGGIAATTVQAALAELDGENDARLDLIETDTTAIKANNWVTQPRIADASVGTAELIDGNVTTAKILDANVTPAKLAASLPRGTIGYAVVTSNVSTFVVPNDLIGATITFTAVAGRRYKISAQVMFVVASNPTQCDLHIVANGTIIQHAIGSPLVANDIETVTSSIIHVPGAGSITYKLSASRQGGTGSLTTLIDATRPDFILVEDIGV